MFDLRCHFTDFHIITHKAHKLENIRVAEQENEHFSPYYYSKMSETEIGDASARTQIIQYNNRPER